MKITIGKVILKDDDLVIEVSGGKTIHINTKSLGNKQYGIGEEVQGVIIDKQFNVCREYEYRNAKNVMFGFISEDELHEDNIKITLIDKGEVGDSVSVQRNLVSNY